MICYTIYEATLFTTSFWQFLMVTLGSGNRDRFRIRTLTLVMLLRIIIFGADITLLAINLNHFMTDEEERCVVVNI